MICDEAEILVCQQGAGALPDATTLDAHLATCAACTAFQQRSRNMDSVMQAKLVEQMGQLNFSEMQARLRGFIRREKRSLLMGSILLVVLSTIITAVQGGPTLASYVEAAAWPLCAGGLVLALQLWRFRRRAREVAEAASSPVDLVVTFRMQVQRKFRLFGIGGVLSIIYAIYFGQRAIHYMASKPHEAWMYAAFTALFCFVFIRAVVGFINLRAQIRELK